VSCFPDIKGAPRPTSGILQLERNNPHQANVNVAIYSKVVRLAERKDYMELKAMVGNFNSAGQSSLWQSTPPPFIDDASIGPDAFAHSHNMAKANNGHSYTQGSPQMVRSEFQPTETKNSPGISATGHTQHSHTSHLNPNMTHNQANATPTTQVSHSHMNQTSSFTKGYESDTFYQSAKVALDADTRVVKTVTYEYDNTADMSALKSRYSLLEIRAGSLEEENRRLLYEKSSFVAPVPQTKFVERIVEKIVVDDSQAKILQKSVFDAEQKLRVTEEIDQKHIMELKYEIAELRKRLEVKDQILHDENSKMHLTISTLKSDTQCLQQDLKQEQSRYTSLSTQISSHQSELDRLRESFYSRESDLKKEYENLQEDNSRLYHENATSTQDNRRLLEENERLHRSGETQLITVKSLKEEILRVQSEGRERDGWWVVENGRLAKEKERLSNEVGRLEHELGVCGNYEAKIHHLEAEIVRIQGEGRESLVFVRNQNMEMKSKIDGLNSELLVLGGVRSRATELESQVVHWK
jgi:hypothetical protein